MTVITGPGSDITARIEISIDCEPTPMTTKARPIPERLHRPALEASERGVRRRDERYSNSCQSRKQDNPFCKVPGCPLLPSWQAFRVLKRNASARSQSHGHQLSGFSGERLSLRSLMAKVMRVSLPLTFSHLFFLLFKNGAKVRPLVAIGASDRSPHPYVISVPFFCFTGLRQRTANIDNRIPFALSAQDLGGLAKSGPWIIESTIQCSVLAGRQIKLAVTGETLNMHPEIPVGRMPGLLHLGGITKLGVQVGQLELLFERFGCFPGPFVVIGGSVAHPLLKLTLSSLALALEDKLTFLSHDRVQKVKLPVLLPGKVVTQHRQHVTLDARDIELDPVGQGQGFLGLFHHADLHFGQILTSSCLGTQIWPQRRQVRCTILTRTLRSIPASKRRVKDPAPCEVTGSRHSAIITLGTHDATPSLGFVRLRSL